VLRRLSPVKPRPTFVLRSNGFSYRCEPGSYIDWAIATLGDYEPEQKRLFLGLFPPNRRRTILDIGANIGAHSLSFSRHFGQVLAFEPNPQVFEKLKANLALNPEARIEPFRIGLSDRPGEAVFYQPLEHGDNLGLGTFDPASRTEPCTVVTLPIERGDAFLANRQVGPIDAIKIDVQGLEAKVLAGLRATIERDRPLIWVEMSFPTLGDLAARGGLGAIMPPGYRLLRFVVLLRFGLFRHRLVPTPALDRNHEADYLLVPDDWPMPEGS
jgi:FkbM family methyltransferase